MEAQFHETGVVLGSEIDPAMDSVTHIGSVQVNTHQQWAQSVSRHAAEKRLKGVIAAIKAKHSPEIQADPAKDPEKTFHACPACKGSRVEQTQLVQGVPLYANNACRQCQGTGHQ